MAEIQIKQSSQIIEVDMDLPESPSSPIRNKICRGTACDFSDPNSKDANERSKSMRKLLIAVVLCIIFMSVEVVCGIKANSLAILTDAAHLLSDVAAFAISLFSLWASGWEANPRQSYGFFRIEILGALVSIQLIWLLTGILVYEAVARMVRDGGEVHGFLMFVVSAFGLVVNIVMTVLLGHDHGHAGHGHDHSHSESDHDHRDHHDEHGHSITAHHHHSHHHGHDGHEPLLNQSDGTPKKKSAPRKRNINVHSAYLHVIGDSIQSAGVMIGGAIIWYDPGLKIIDLVCTIVFSVIVLVTTVRMLRSILEVLMESTPREVDATRIENGLKGIEGVVAVHELHIWAITVGKVLLACHVTVTPEADADAVLDTVIGYIRREHNISHITIQVERH